MRARFFRRMAIAASAVLVLAAFGLFGAVWTIAGRFGGVGWFGAAAPLIVLIGVFAIAMAALGAMRGFAAPLGAVMDAADRVAEGNYTVRVREYGPPPVQALARSFNTMTARLQDADRLRRDLMADVAHELRTPLTIVQGRLEGILDGVYPADERQISQLLDETRVLSKLVEDLRTLALTEAGALPLQVESTDVVGLVRETIGSMQPEARPKSIELKMTSHTDGVVLDLDALRIREVLTNLLSNAIRHTPEGGTVNVSIDDSADAVTVTVRDTGEGMSPEEVARIFDRFYKGSTSRGSGLGLTIAKGIIEAHRGKITASSQPGAGTTIGFTLPR